eukprot:31160-Pelagococcus_subviridis.AAC.18
MGTGVTRTHLRRRAADAQRAVRDERDGVRSEPAVVVRRGRHLELDRVAVDRDGGRVPHEQRDGPVASEVVPRAGASRADAGARVAIAEVDERARGGGEQDLALARGRHDERVAAAGFELRGVDVPRLRRRTEGRGRVRLWDARVKSDDGKSP